MKKFAPLLGLVGILVASAALDLEFFRLGRIAGMTFRFAPLMWDYFLFLLLWGLLIGLLAWWVLFRAERSRLVLVLFIVVGLLIVLLPVTYLSGISLHLPPQVVNVFSSVIALTIHAGIACMIIGVGGFVWRKKPA